MSYKSYKKITPLGLEGQPKSDKLHKGKTTLLDPTPTQKLIILLQTNCNGFLKIFFDVGCSLRTGVLSLANSP